MSKRDSLGQMVLTQLSQICEIRRLDIGADARLAKSGMVFNTESYEIDGVGHLCVLGMNAMLGLMKMETVVLSCVEKDLPLVNLDWVRAFGKETQIVELYDTQLQPCSQQALEAFQAVSDRDTDLTNYSSGKKAWYDDILYPCSYHKTGKGVTARLSAAAADYTRLYLGLMTAAGPCDPEAKKAKVRDFAETLFDKGGPAVDQVTKLFGRDTARRLILRHMYGIDG